MPRSKAPSRSPDSAGSKRAASLPKKSRGSDIEVVVEADKEGEEEGSESSLDSIEKDELKRKLHKMAAIISVWTSKQGQYKDKVRSLLTIGGNFENADSIF